VLFIIKCKRDIYIDQSVNIILSTRNLTSACVQIFDFIKIYNWVQSLFKIFLQKNKQSSILLLNLMCSDLIYLWNQAKIVYCKNTNLDVCCEARFDALKSTYYLSSKCCWRTLIRHLGLIQQSFVFCKLQAYMKEAWELLRKVPCLKCLS